MKKLLFQLDTDSKPSAFDIVVAYDGGADHVSSYSSITPENVKPIIEGSIFTRAPKDKKNTALFIGGSDLEAGQQLFEAVQKQFFSNFRVSLMLDSNGANTTAAACIAMLTKDNNIKGMNAVILGGTGPVGQRAAIMLAQEGAQVSITGRQFEKTKNITDTIHKRFSVDISPLAAPELHDRQQIVENMDIVIATGASGVVLLDASTWQNSSTIKLLADANASPPAGIEGIEIMDKGIDRFGKKTFGSIGFGSLKLALHRKCIEKLFEANNIVLDANEIYALAKDMIRE
ncbi:NADP-dependent methylenetetrahydromethanopterin/methylenetetrahydrofolate dehydrogenase [Ferrovum sp. PN-J185]|uniref:NADP-dependent methylenetetrahydromethanopterin/methylenetetrahydrofolate dehydrogenase n=1 Tax=Ferrovum sp. PN-J185 TaxID=1356306 RepID=UPI000798D68B|nr:NADP-dependent methylenetetrahydromethanopterin/methylenetetrahydrofolate dehydrogenase [Ferrovum sp. PN-J185]KXW56838.1 bifunctional protein MdtA [Ferrovum sp. PN-J185]MCC6069294.1 NADP-dependent methylenetetrahydromethanopterin/methylenetetrahydrofolate dehydrogenase [Ferrovum sp. PN-J185]MDE1891406.1 methylenetetrahydrofolate dehydrogenase [Betaproteobacteria bacterium]MDE2056068.1 methylenetetrahydrofolate dehydrogenase [Betaproteobacteria bacterium]